MDSYSTYGESTITFLCGGRSFMIDRELVIQKSKPLEILINKQAPGQDEPRDLIWLENDLPQDVEKMMNFLYKGFYTTTSDPAPEDKGTALIDSVRMFLMGEKYDIEGLELEAKHNVLEAMKSDWTPSQFIAAIDALCTNLVYNELPSASVVELKDILIKHSATLPPYMIMELFSDYEPNGFNEMCCKFLKSKIDIGTELSGEVEKGLEEVRKRGMGVPGIKCPDCHAVGMLEKVDVTRGIYYCIACPGMVYGKVPGTW